MDYADEMIRSPGSFSDLPGQGVRGPMLIVEKKELADGIAVSNQHERQQDHVPESEPVEERGYRGWRIHGQCVAHGRHGFGHGSEARSNQDVKEEENGDDQNATTDHRQDDEKRCLRSNRIRVVEDRVASSLAHETRNVPRYRRDQDAPEPKP